MVCGNIAGKIEDDHTKKERKMVFLSADKQILVRLL
jgi:hypothetical protein